MPGNGYCEKCDGAGRVPAAAAQAGLDTGKGRGLELYLNWFLIKVLSPVFEVNYTKDSLFFCTYSTTVYLLCIILLAEIEMFSW